jgi:hypothetical protein
MIDPEPGLERTLSPGSGFLLFRKFRASLENKVTAKGGISSNSGGLNERRAKFLCFEEPGG